MTEHDDLVTRLHGLGQAEPPEPSEAFLDGLTGGRLGRRTLAAPPRVLRLPLVLPAAALAAAVLGFVLVTFGGHGPPDTIVVRSVVDTRVELDGRAVPVGVGDPLPEGAKVTTGPAGSLTAGNQIVGPGEKAVVRGGRLRWVAPAAVTTTTTTVVRPATTTTTTSPAPTSTTTVAPRPRPGVAPAPDGSTSTTTVRSAPRPGVGWQSLPVQLQLAGRRKPDGTVVGLRWTPYQGPDFGAYVVIREDRTVVARRLVVDRTAAADQAAPVEPTHYVVVVMDSSRRPIARSDVVVL